MFKELIFYSNSFQQQLTDMPANVPASDVPDSSLVYEKSNL